MHDLLRSAIRITWSRNGAYALRLVGDLAPGRFLAQPVPGAVTNHPAWILCHLNVYMPVILALLRGDAVDDPLGRPHARNSKVTLDPADYPSPAVIIDTYRHRHDEVLAALDAANPETFARPNPVERWRAMHPLVADQLVTLMVKHESFHLGQLSAWRRGMGLASVEM